jgi:AraC family transcriptional regulator of arabinose operon
MKIVNVGYEYRHPSDFVIDRPLGSGDYMLLIIRSESFAYLLGERVMLPQNSVIVYNKGTKQLYGASGGEYVNDWLHFELDKGEEEFILSLGIAFDKPYFLTDTAELSSFIKNIFREKYSENAKREESARRYFELLILKLSEKISERHPDREHPYYNAFLRLRNDIKLAPGKKWTVDEVSREINLSRSYLQHLYKRFFGIGIIADIRRCRLELAEYLLTATDMTVFDISVSCGYENDVHFMRLFKKEKGKTPTEFRKTHRIKNGMLEAAKSSPPFNIR